jgi:tricorn protease
MRKIIMALVVSIVLAAVAPAPVSAQINAALFRYPAISKTQIVFSYANDLWIVPKEGGTASRIASPPGTESFPKFSPDGNTIAYTADYDGNNSIYTIPAAGGIPTRLTWQGSPERVVDWYPDGKFILFASGRESERERFNQFYKIRPSGGMAEKLPLPYAEFGTLSPDGTSLALTFKSQISRNWKRYRGGWIARIHLFNLTDYSSEDISGASEAADELPMWHDHSIFFLSDRGPENRMNLWQYDITAKTFTQLTHFADYDTHYPSLGPDDIVFENAGKLFIYSIAAKAVKEVPVHVITDEMTLRPTLSPVEKYINHSTIAPDGKRVLVEARGEVFSLPAENGPVKDLTQTADIAERYPTWSPDGKWIAYWSDRSGEYQLTLRNAAPITGQNAGPASAEQQLTHYGPGYRYRPYWSPDSRRLAFIDQAMKIHIYDRTTNQTTDIDQGLRLLDGGCEAFAVSWSADSRWMAYDRDLPNGHNAVYIYDCTDKALHPVTSGYYSCTNPVFDREGKYLFLLTNQSFNPSYSDIDNTFIYANSTHLAAISLKKSTPSPLYPKNDTVAIRSDETPPANGGAAKPPTSPKKDKPSDPPAKPVPVDIDIDGLESRMIFLPGDAGNYINLHSGAEGRLIYQQNPNTGSSSHTHPLYFYDIDKRKQKTILDDANSYDIAADGKRLLVTKDGALYIIAADETQKLEKKLPTADMQMWQDPRKEWRQILVDAWRIERDYFYDPSMHGIDWNKVKERYLAMLEGATTRDELNFIIGEMLGELSSSHTYHGGGAGETPPHANVGYLGVDWTIDGDHYKIKKIVRGAPWDTEIRSPLDQPGVMIKEGDYILAVDGMELSTKYEPYAPFRNLAGHSIELTYNSSPSWTGAHTVIVVAMADESRLRNLAWIEHNRQRVAEATGGKAGYIHVPSTGADGQSELIRQFTAQLDKAALVIDERFNNGGQIPDRFIEMLDRKPLAYWATRDGTPWQWPPAGHFGPKVMLINGWSGSGGDAFPDFFRKAGLGPLIGNRTWGGLIGISGAPSLIDGGVITVPTFRMYNLDGSWFKEGHGVDPDIPIAEDLTQGAHGKDNQLERAIVEINELLKTKAFMPPKTPPYEKR